MMLDSSCRRFWRRCVAGKPLKNCIKEISGGGITPQNFIWRGSDKGHLLENLDSAYAQIKMPLKVMLVERKAHCYVANAFSSRLELL